MGLRLTKDNFDKIIDLSLIHILYYEQIAESAILNDDIKKGEKFIEYAIYYADKYDLIYRKAKNLALKAEMYLKSEEYVLAQQYLVPFKKREPAQPVPYLRVAATAASIIRSS